MHLSAITIARCNAAAPVAPAPSAPVTRFPTMHGLASRLAEMQLVFAAQCRSIAAAQSEATMLHRLKQHGANYDDLSEVIDAWITAQLRADAARDRISEAFAVIVSRDTKEIAQ
jgi:hypothetical protein